MVLRMRELIEMIESAIEKEIERKGAMGTESVSVSLSMTDEELEIFRNIDLFDTENYSWEIEDNKLYITYAEEV
jgi:hypothetical protein